MDPANYVLRMTASVIGFVSRGIRWFFINKQELRLP